MPPPRQSLDCLLSPRSVAIVGASDDPARIGGRPLRFMRELGFAGSIHPVNPKRQTVQGLPAVPSLDALEQPIDLAVIATPAATVPEALAAAARKGAGAAVIFSSGFAETGPDGAAMQREIERISAETAIRVLGPNALGFYSAPSRVAATFSSLLEKGAPPEGPVALVSQSGAFGAHIAVLATERGIGLRHWVTTGNEVDVGATDCIAAFADDPGVTVIAVYVEGVRDGRAFLAAISAARAARKRVVVMKVGRTGLGGAAAQSHTASLAGDDAVFHAALTDAGAERALRADAFLEAIYALSRGTPIGGDKLGILTVSGGAGVLMADAAADAGFILPPMPGDAQARLHEICPFGSAMNPLDVTAHAMNEMSLVEAHIREMFSAGGYDAAAGFFMNWPKSPALADRLKAAVAKGCEGFGERVFAIVANADADSRREFEAQGAMVFEDPTAAIEALAALRRQSVPFALRAAALPAPAAAPLPGPLDEHGAMTLLRDAGIAFPNAKRAETPSEAGAAAEALGGPVALKILSPDLAHKSEVGGVALALNGADEVAAAAGAMAARVAEAAPAARQQGFLVAPMVAGVAECIVGARIDPVFGPVVLVGLGGVFAEIFEDVAIRLAPVSQQEALAMIAGLRGAPLFHGARGRPKPDVDALAATVAALSRFAATHAKSLVSVELNPVAVRGVGAGAIALDAVIECRSGVPC